MENKQLSSTKNTRRSVNRYQALFNEEIEVKHNDKKGRNPDLIIFRNECLFARFYYYSKMQRLRYEDVLRNLSMEFFLSPVRVAILIQSSPKNVFKEFEDWSLKKFEQKYYFLTWKTQKNEQDFNAL